MSTEPSFPFSGLPRKSPAGGLIEGRLFNELVEVLDKRLVLSPISYYVSPGKEGAFQSVNEAIEWGIKDTPITVPRRIVPIALHPGVEHEVDYLLPATHSFAFYTAGEAISAQFNPVSFLVGNLAVEPYQQSAIDPEGTRVLFDNVALGNGAPGSLVIDARYGWGIFGQRALVLGLSYQATHDPGISGYHSNIDLVLSNFNVNQSQEFLYTNDAKADPTTRLIFRDGFMFGIPEVLPNFRFAGSVDVDFERIAFLSLSNPGSVFSSAPGSTGAITFSDTRWSYFPLFGPIPLFEPNMAGVRIEWVGKNVFTEMFGPGPQPVDFSNVAAHYLAPEFISAGVPTSPPTGTKRRDVGVTEKDLFWNGIAWV